MGQELYSLRKKEKIALTKEKIKKHIKKTNKNN